MSTDKNTEKWVKGYQVPSEKGKEEAWLELKSKMSASKPGEVHSFYVKKRFYLAASVLVAAVLFSFIFDSVYGRRQYITEGGEQQKIVLPDSTRVTLNPSSKLMVHYSVITGKRKLDLDGEALFKVTPGKLFKVKFPGGNVRVLGTRFTVSAYKDVPAQINCLSGKVKVSAGKKETVLNPGKGVIIDSDKKLLMVNMKNKVILAEMAGIYNWKNVPLRTVFNTIENFTGYKISAADSIKNRKFTGNVDLNNLEETCRTLSFAMDLKYKSIEKTKTIVFETSE